MGEVIIWIKNRCQRGMNFQVNGEGGVGSTVYDVSREPVGSCGHFKLWTIKLGAKLTK